MEVETFGQLDIMLSTVGLNEATIRKYIREQENEDMIQDKLTKKEYINPFKGILK